MRTKDIFRMLFILMYMLTSIINIFIGIKNPEIIRSLSETTFISYLGNLISVLPTWTYIAGLWGFAVYQILLAILLSLNGRFVKLGIIGAIAFHVSIIPFGWFNLFNLLFIIPLLFLANKNYENNLISGIISYKKIMI